VGTLAEQSEENEDLAPSASVRFRLLLVLAVGPMKWNERSKAEPPDFVCGCRRFH
jgi:hypothetical protein